MSYQNQEKINKILRDEESRNLDMMAGDIPEIKIEEEDPDEYYDNLEEGR